MIGRTIARYEIRSEIGRGGMAAVYLAYDPNFRRSVAVKLVSVNLRENPVFRERFEREARLIAKIEHPAIVPVYDFGEQDNQLYLVMRYMSGGALSGKIREGASSLEFAARIISQIAPALDAVHAQGIVHRDLKPGNILLDGFGNPAISDFGIAHFSAATTDLTGSAVIGTPSYMSPEQVRSDIELDGRSDIYALGVILFEMLTGRGPFHAATPLSAALKHLTEPIPSIRSHRPDLPAEVELVLNKAMAKDREERHAAASELARELQAILGAARKETFPATLLETSPPREDASTEIDFGGTTLSENPPSAPPRQSDARSAAMKPTDGSPMQSRQSFPRWTQITALVGAGLVALALCVVIGLLGTWAGFRLPALSPTETSPTPSPPLPPSALPTQAVVLFADDFSDHASGWPTIQNAQGWYGYRDDGYHISVAQLNTALWAKTNRKDGDATISVDARPVAGGADGYYGLLCRIQDNQDFYYFVVRSNGDYTIGKYKNAEFQSLFVEGWRQGAASGGGQASRLAAECAGNLLRLYVNNILLGETRDSDFASGFSGVIAAALSEQGFEARFNNFLITQSSP
jgi:serine/threonine-protein kinase